MRKIYLKLLPAFLLCTATGSDLNAQCPVIAAPVISGNTLVCNSTGVFTLTASGAPSAIFTWYASPTGGSTVAAGAVFTTPVVNAGTTTYYATQQVGTAGSQSIALPPFGQALNAMARGYYFTAPTAFTITGIRVPTDASQGVQSVAIMSLSGTPPNNPSVNNTFTTLFLDQLDYGSGQNTISVNIPVNYGDIIGVFGDRNDTTSYYLGNPYSTTLGSFPISIARLGMLYTLSTTAPQDIWTEPPGTGKIGRVELYTTIGCVSPLASYSMVVSNPPQISISGPVSTLCADTVPVLLTASGAPTFTWSTGPNTNTINVSGNNSGSYSVNSKNSYGCASSASFAVTIQQLPNVMITPSSSVICQGNSGTLTLSGASNYTWNTGFNTTSIVISPNQTATYSAVGQDSIGCWGSATLVVPVSPKPTVTISTPKNTICVGESAILTATGAATYSWNTGANTQTISVSPNGSKSYTAVGTNTAGCSKQYVITINALICTGIEQNSANINSIRIFPNPSNGLVTIESDEVLPHVILKDIAGRVILDQHFDALTSLSLNLDNLNAGVYFIELPQNKVNRTFKLVKE